MELALDELISLFWSPEVMTELRRVLLKRKGAVHSNIADKPTPDVGRLSRQHGPFRSHHEQPALTPASFPVILHAMERPQEKPAATCMHSGPCELYASYGVLRGLAFLA
jgi:hypothetical protein